MPTAACCAGHAMDTADRTHIIHGSHLRPDSPCVFLSRTNLSLQVGRPWLPSSSLGRRASSTVWERTWSERRRCRAASFGGKRGAASVLPGDSRTSSPAELLRPCARNGNRLLYSRNNCFVVPFCCNSKRKLLLGARHEHVLVSLCYQL
jgi:hypothetical protein